MPWIVRPIAGASERWTGTFGLAPRHESTLTGHPGFEEQSSQCTWPGCGEKLAGAQSCKRHEILHLSHRSHEECDCCSSSSTRADGLSRPCESFLRFLKPTSIQCLPVRSKAGQNCQKQDEAQASAMNLNNSNFVGRGSVEAQSNDWSVDAIAPRVSTVLIPDASNLDPHVSMSKTGSSSEYSEDKKVPKADSFSRPLKSRRVLEVARIFGILCWAIICSLG